MAASEEDGSRRLGFLSEDAAIELNVVVGHAMGVETLARPLKSTIGKVAAHLNITAIRQVNLA